MVERNVDVFLTISGNRNGFKVVDLCDTQRVQGIMNSRELTWLGYGTSSTILAVGFLLVGRHLIGGGSYWSGGVLALLGLCFVLAMVSKVLDFKEMKSKSKQS
jgi:hypothetical protein